MADVRPGIVQTEYIHVAMQNGAIMKNGPKLHDLLDEVWSPGLYESGLALDDLIESFHV